MTGRAGGAVLIAALALAAPAAAQVDNGAAPAAAATSVPIPPPPVIVLPTPTASPTPRATATAERAPVPRATALPTRVIATPSPTPFPTPVAAPSPAAQPAPAAAPSSSPVAMVNPTASVDADDATLRYWLVGVVAVGLALAALGWVLQRRRRADAVEPVDEAAWIEEAPPVEAVAVPRARLAIEFRPRRAGLNMLSATSENEITITNIGDDAAANIRLQLRLISAHAGQDTELAAFYAEPIGRPAVPAFSLAPGESRVAAAVAALARDAIRTLTAAGRPMFVPIVAINIVYDSGAGEGQLAQAFAVGVERVDSAKLAPFWLDTPPRTHDQVAARPHAAALER